jgi:c-di-GMP phosphodiesterase
MLRQLFSRLVSGGAPAVPTPVEQTVAEPIRSAQPAPADGGWIGIGARRPLLSPRGEVAGFEFRIADVLMQRADAAARAAHTISLLTAMQLTVRGGRVSLGELPASWLMQPQVGALLAPGMLMCIGHDDSGGAGVRVQAARLLRSGGVRVGWAIQDVDTESPPDFVLLRPRPDEQVASMLRSAQHAVAGHAGLGIVATDLPHLDDLEFALANGVQYACGTVSSSSQPPAGGAMSAAVQRVCDLLNRLVHDEEVTALALEIKHDPGLSLQLLRYAGSAHFSRGRPVDSVEAAVLLLGRDELYRWLSMVLVRSAGARASSRAVQEVTLARARLLELLAAARGEPQPEGFFTLGLASMLPLLLDAPAQTVLSRLHLAPPAQAALLEATGPWHVYLRLAKALERHDLAHVEQLAGDFGGLSGVLGCAEQAWAWTHAQDPTPA